jgi:quinoprotein glucose dehydrogenase
MPSRPRRTFFFASLAVAAVLPAQSPPYRPALLGPSREAEMAMRKFQLADDLTVSLWAAEPQVGNPVALWIDARARVFVAETFRLHKGVTDNRKYAKDWVEAELACRSVADRIAQYERFFQDKLPALTTEHERVRLLWDSDGDGRADKDTVFADGFNRLEDGIGSGVLEHQGDVFFTCIPKLWRLRDRDGDGVAEERAALHDGFGVHTALLGHDMHGLVLGPDGRLYFSIGDRGLHVTTSNGVLSFPDEGAVLRCELDGSGLEVFHRGLRNPQELAFDDFGNLFTGDNNSDGGDRARFVYLLPGGDCGWRVGFQTINDRGPWNQEKLWHPPFRGQAAYLNPPIDNYVSGPSGLCFDPGTGLPARWRRHFLLCDFRGSSANSGVFALRLEPKGAGFELASEGPVIKSVLATDVDVGPDGAIWLTDWTEGWEQPMKGRIYRIEAHGLAADASVRETTRLLQRDWSRASTAELFAALGHADRRVRQAAQFAVAARGEAVQELQNLASVLNAPRMARVHAIWALGQMARKGNADALAPAPRWCDDADHEIRAQAARVCGDARLAGAADALIARLRDRSSRVRALAALALGQLGVRAALLPLLRVVRENDDRDPWLRHAAVQGLAGVADAPALLAHADDGSELVRLALCVALRRQASPHVARFLDDRAASVAVEAARAVHDVPIEVATPALAAVLNRRDVQDPAFVRRALAANHRVGDAASAERIATFAARTDADDKLRVLALATLAAWPHPSARDRVLDLWRPLPDRGPELAVAALGVHLRALLERGSDAVAAAAAQTAGTLHLTGFAADLETVARDDKRGGKARGAALEALEKLAAPGSAATAATLASSSDPALRQAAMAVVSRLDPDAAVAVLDQLVASAPWQEQQNALAALGDSKSAAADAVLVRWLEVCMQGKLAPNLHLDLLEAAGKRQAPAVQESLAAYERARPAHDALAPWRETLAGGDAERGEHLFWNHEAAVCTRCHAIKDSGGTAGPAMHEIGSKLTREQLLESLVLPQARIADGHGTVVLTRKGGASVAGILRHDDGQTLRVQTPEGEIVELRGDEVQARTPAISAMPPMAAILTKRELRDVVEFLAQQTGEPK